MIPKQLVRGAVVLISKGLVALLIGTNVSLYNPALAQAPVNETEGRQLPNIQTLSEHPLANSFELDEKTNYKFILYVETLAEGLSYKDFVRLKELIHCESSWRPRIYGDSGKAYSLAQFHEPTFEDFKRWSEQSHFEYKNPEHQLKLLVWAYKNHKMKNWTCWNVGSAVKK